MTENPNLHGDPPGTGWRLASWMAFALAAVVAWLVLRTKSDNYVEGFLTMLVGFLVFLFGGLGVVFGIFGAVASAQVGDKRFVVMLPVWANAALLFWYLAVILT